MAKMTTVNVNIADYGQVKAAIEAGARAAEALQEIRKVGSSNSWVVAGLVAWGLGETDEAELIDPATGRVF